MDFSVILGLLESSLIAVLVGIAMFLIYKYHMAKLRSKSPSKSVKGVKDEI